MNLKRKITAITAGVMITGAAFSQSVTYKIMKDDPSDVNNVWLMLDVAQMDFSPKNIEGSSFNIGVWGIAHYKERLGVEGAVRYGYFTFGKLGNKNAKSHIAIEAGALLHLSDGTGTHGTKVILSQKSYTSGNTKYTETKSIKVNATRRKQIGVRAGLYHLGGPLNTEKYNPEGGSLPELMNYSMTGVYAGIFSCKTTNLLLNTDLFGKVGVFKRSRLGIDALILPIKTVKLDGKDYKSDVKSAPIGGRLFWMVLPAEKRKLPNYDVKTRGMGAVVEVGFRPYDGLYWACTWSIPLHRGKSVKLGYTLPETEKNTAE